MTPGFVFDSGALIALERPSAQRRLHALFHKLGEEGRTVISAGSLAEVWRGSARQAPLGALLRRSSTHVVELTLPVAKAIGRFMGDNSGDDIVDAHVVMLARSQGLAVVTSDPGDLLALDPKLPCITV